ncbi:hypothetical protein AKJ45_01240 [candidate division MSBL1 archaeon SCGC-AAA261F19]|uniref:H/ACA RNA-protein complex protein Gar1 n=1 Tax=candidate division MSBL1 archaeon SCGC-AAA261F19 TaxID=1698275 RepID=A0A133VAY1_9EURY|nr:hypothetical protein AKJ45_01240 [candidate division MSBL1 archaeon SCGC-AAA261F19]
MPRLGRVIRSEGKELLIRAERVPKLGEKIQDNQDKIIGEVSSIFGPVDKPYVTAKLTKKSKANRPSFNDKEVYI